MGLPDSTMSLPPTDPTDNNVDMSLAPAESDALDSQPDENVPRIYTPPPHIAARFYKPTQYRRKDSAASSRRNSISSLQSLSTNNNALMDSSPQSKHVAQHLRRASILEDRQKRLADRAAHAEKVRLRAAKAKAEATTRDISASEERALAVQQARKLRLDEIAASCAEEVKRAKAVAESMKEKREQDLQKMRLQIEERLADAERRREELRNKGGRTRARDHSMITNRKSFEVMPEVKEMKERDSLPMTEGAAALKIHSWWRGVMRRDAVSEFTGLGLNIDSIRDTSFETAREILTREQVIVATARTLAICGLNEGRPGSVEQMAAAKHFLAAHLILGHPAQVLINKDGNENQEQVGALAKPMPKDDLADPRLQELVGKARDLLISFENILARLTSFNNYTVPPALARTLPEVYATFHNAFIAWKARDKDSLIEMMVLQFVELDAIVQTVKNSTDPAVTEQYRTGVKDSQIKLFARIKHLAGGRDAAKKMVFKAVEEARKRARAQKIPKGDTKPRIADQSMTPESAMADLATGDRGTPPTSHIATASAVYPTPPSTPASKQRVPVKGRLLPDNRIVVHELAINKEYRVAPDDFLQAETEALKPDLEQMRIFETQDGSDSEARHFRLLLKIAYHIRERLQRLVRPGNMMHTTIGEMLDVEIIGQQFQTGHFSYEHFFSKMGTLLPKLCAPVRDDEVKDLVENKLSQGSYVDRVEALILFIDVMLSDYANHLLHMVAPQLLESATIYEADHFGKEFGNGENSLPAAEVAWRAARTKVLAEAARRDPEGVNHPKNRPTPDKFYTQMLVDIFTQVSPTPLEALPEMLRLDHKRVIKHGQMTRKIITTGAILLQCKNLLKRDVRAPWNSEATRIMIVLDTAKSDEAAVNGTMAALEAGRSMPAATKGHLRGLVQKLLAASKGLATRSEAGQAGPWDPASCDPKEPVLRLLLNRLRGHVLARMAAASASDMVKATTTAGEKLASLGLAEFVEKVREMIDEMTKVGWVDRQAHGSWWEVVADKVERDDAIASISTAA